MSDPILNAIDKARETARKSAQERRNREQSDNSRSQDGISRGST